jgi:hypothetical protein
MLDQRCNAERVLEPFIGAPRLTGQRHLDLAPCSPAVKDLGHPVSVRAAEGDTLAIRANDGRAVNPETGKGDDSRGRPLRARRAR